MGSATGKGNLLQGRGPTVHGDRWICPGPGPDQVQIRSGPGSDQGQNLGDIRVAWPGTMVRPDGRVVRVGQDGGVTLNQDGQGCQCGWVTLK